MLSNKNCDMHINSSSDHENANENSKESSNNSLFQSLPFRTDFYGSTDIDVNFTQHTMTKVQAVHEQQNNDAFEGKHSNNKEDSNIYYNQFRGRTLIGRKVELPEHMCIVAVQNLSEIQKESMHIPVYATNSHFMRWEHDYEPENVKGIAQWTEIAKLIHDDEQR